MGNFNEKTANIYTDFGLFSCRRSLTTEVNKVFLYLAQKNMDPEFKTLLVAPFNMRKTFYRLIDNEIKNAGEGKTASIILKLNSLEDKKIIQKLYRASQAGVKIDLIIRGICCLVPGLKNLSENINLISIVDRYLEHSRIYYFHNNGDPEVYIGSADLMDRNLLRRVEVIFPVEPKALRDRMIHEILEISLADNVKARTMHPEGIYTLLDPDEDEPMGRRDVTIHHRRNLEMTTDAATLSASCVSRCGIGARRA